MSTGGGPGMGQANGTQFGTGVGGGWGEPALAAEDQGELLPNGGVFHLKDGHRFHIVDSEWRALLNSQYALDAITARSEQLCDLANSMVAMSPQRMLELNDGDPEGYGYEVQSRDKRPAGKISYKNMGGYIDNLHYETLEKARMSCPSDPIPRGAGPSDLDVQHPDAGGVSGNEYPIDEA